MSVVHFLTSYLNPMTLTTPISSLLWLYVTPLALMDASPWLYTLFADTQRMDVPLMM